MFWNPQDLLLLMVTETFKIDASWAEKLTKNERVSKIMAPLWYNYHINWTGNIVRNRHCNKQTHVLSSVKVSFPPEDLLELLVCFCLFDNIFCLKCLISMSLLVLVPRLTGERNAADWNTEPILCCTSSKLAKLGSKIVIAFQEFVCLWKILKKWKK